MATDAPRGADGDEHGLVDEHGPLVTARRLGHDLADGVEITRLRPQADGHDVLEARFLHEREVAGVVDVALRVEVGVADGDGDGETEVGHTEKQELKELVELRFRFIP